MVKSLLIDFQLVVDEQVTEVFFRDEASTALICQLEEVSDAAASSLDGVEQLVHDLLVVGLHE